MPDITVEAKDLRVELAEKAGELAAVFDQQARLGFDQNADALFAGRFGNRHESFLKEAQAFLSRYAQERAAWFGRQRVRAEVGRQVDAAQGVGDPPGPLRGVRFNPGRVIGVPVGMVHESIEVGYRHPRIVQGLPDGAELPGGELSRVGVRNVGHDLDSPVSGSSDQVDGVEETVSAEGIGTERKFHGYGSPGPLMSGIR